VPRQQQNSYNERQEQNMPKPKLKKSPNEEIKKRLLELNEGLEQNLAALDSYTANISRLHEELTIKLQGLSETAVQSVGALLNATQVLQETQMSFNLQYLQLQSQMQNDNRQYTAVSNIMKTKHDTVKNTISNIR
jgi:hypothetical protein